MDPFRIETGIAALLPAANVNTDVIMPKQFLRGVTRDGLARGVFYDLRFDEDGNERSDFILNRPEFRGTRFLVVGPNFGCGSSREHAVWGLKQFGIRSIIGTTYGIIFYDNCFQNGLLPISLAGEDYELLQRHCREVEPAHLTVDLVECGISGPWGRIAIDVAPMMRERLLEGLDSIGATLKAEAEIRAFESRYLAEVPWVRAERETR